MTDPDDLRSLIRKNHRRLQLLKEQQASFGPLHTPVHILTEIEDTETEIQRLQAELAAIESELQQIGYVTPEVSLNLVNETLAKPEDFVSLHHLSLSLDRSGIKREQLRDTVSVNRLELSEISIKGQPSRVVTLAKIRRNEVEQVSRLSS